MILDKSTNQLVERKYNEAIAKLESSGRTLTESEKNGIKQKVIAWALSVKEKAKSIEEVEQEKAEVIAKDIDEALESFKVNANYVRMTLGMIGKSLGYNVHAVGTRSGNELEIDLPDDIGDVLGDLFESEDDEAVTMEYLVMKDNRQRDVTAGKAKPKAEDDPVFKEIQAIVPTLKEMIAEQGERIAVKALKHVVKELNGMAYTKIKNEG